jgi:hypothetical protein
MTPDRIVVLRKNAKDVDIENLPDGSTAVFDRITQTIHSLHPLAAAAFQACREQKTIDEVREAMTLTLGADVSEASALGAIAELERAGLVAISELDGASRRSMLTSALKAAGVAAPLVLSLTASEQAVFAQGSGSGTTTTTTTTTSTTTTTTTTTTAGPAPTLNIGPNTFNSCQSSSNFDLGGVNTHFNNTSVVTFNNSQLSASNVVVESAISINLNINNNTQNNVNTQMVTVTVTTGSEVAVGTNILTLTGCT